MVIISVLCSSVRPIIEYSTSGKICIETGQKRTAPHVAEEHQSPINSDPQLFMNQRDVYYAIYAKYTICTILMFLKDVLSLAVLALWLSQEYVIKRNDCGREMCVCVF